MRGRRDGGMQLDKADVEAGEVRKSEEEEEVELALAPPEGSLRASQWKQRHGPLQFGVADALHRTVCDSASAGWMNHSESWRRLQPIQSSLVTPAFHAPQRRLSHQMCSAWRTSLVVF